VNVQSITLALAIVLGGGPTTLDIYPTFTVPLEIPFALPLPSQVWVEKKTGRTVVDGVALPHLVLYRPDLTPDDLTYVMRHEMGHQAQWGALGPTLVPIYLVTRGEPFEDYLGNDQMWIPPREMLQCPMFRWHSDSGVSLMPCWRF
jgi:hypothetical protein